jgi:hypothetical protein
MEWKEVDIPSPSVIVNSGGCFVTHNHRRYFVIYAGRMISKPDKNSYQGDFLLGRKAHNLGYKVNENSLLFSLNNAKPLDQNVPHQFFGCDVQINPSVHPFIGDFIRTSFRISKSFFGNRTFLVLGATFIIETKQYAGSSCMYFGLAHYKFRAVSISNNFSDD